MYNNHAFIITCSNVCVYFLEIYLKSLEQFIGGMGCVKDKFFTVTLFHSDILAVKIWI